MKTTAFTKYHIAAGAKMAEFAGYNILSSFRASTMNTQPYARSAEYST